MSSYKKPIIRFSRIIKHSRGIGFKITFPDKKKAQHYKEMIMYIIKNDRYIIRNNTGIYDNELFEVEKT